MLELRKECSLRSQVHQAELVVACFKAEMGRDPASWEELQADHCCGRCPVRDLQGRPLVLRRTGEVVVVTDADGGRGGDWLTCGPGVQGLAVLACLLIGIGMIVGGLVQKRLRWLAVGALGVGAGILLDRFFTCY